jgi:hypothetical protein
MLGMRQYRENGPFFIIKMRRETGEILSAHRIEELPMNWPDSFVQELKDTADRFFVRSNRKIN